MGHCSGTDLLFIFWSLLDVNFVVFFSVIVILVIVNTFVLISDDVIRRRLLIDGEGGNDDKRLNNLLKTFIRWYSSPDDEDRYATARVTVVIVLTPRIHVDHNVTAPSLGKFDFRCHFGLRKVCLCAFFVFFS